MTKRERDNTINRINKRIVALVKKYGHDFTGYLDIKESIYNYWNVMSIRTNKDGIVQISRHQPTHDEQAKFLDKALENLDKLTKGGSISELTKSAKEDINRDIGPQFKNRIHQKDYITQRAKDIAYVKYWLDKILTEMYTSDDTTNGGNSDFDDLTELLNRPGFGKEKNVSYEEYYHVLKPIVDKYY